MDNINELNLDQMEAVNGGKGGSKEVLPRKQGYICYQIAKGDTLSRIAKSYHTSVKAIMDANVGIISNENDITAGRYIYVPYN